MSKVDLLRQEISVVLVRLTEMLTHDDMDMKKWTNWDMRIRQGGMSLLVLLLMSLAACSTETVNESQPSEGRRLSLVATIGKGDARTSYAEEDNNGRPYLKALWGGKETMTETVTLYTENGVSCGNWVANIPTGGSVTAEFSGNIEAGKTPAKAYYANNRSVTSLSQALDLTVQKQGASGSTAHLSNNDFMIGTVTMPTQGSEESGSIHFDHLTAVLKYTLTFPTAGQQQSPLQVKSLTLKQQKQQEGESEVLKLKQSFDGTSVSETFSQLDLTFTNDGGVVTVDNKLEAYVSLFPSSTQDKKFTLTAQTTGGIYQTNFTINRNLEANNLYTITATMTHCEEYNWYMTPHTNGEGTEVYTIDNAQELAAFAKIVNGEAGMAPDSFEGKIVEMNANISLERNQPWTPIGKSLETPFKGTFDGLHHTVSKLKTDSNKSYQGFFGIVENATIRNLIIEGEVEGTEYVGAVAAYAINSTFSDCTFGNSNLSTSFYVKGLGWIGGVIGYARGSVFEFCVNYGAVEGGDKGYVGGIGGGCEGGSSLRGCSNYGNVAVGQGGCGGGLMGLMYGGYISGCANHGQMTSVAGMIAGILANIAGNMANSVVITGSYSDGNNGNDVWGFGTGDYLINGSYYTGGQEGEGYKEQLSQEDYDAMNELLYGDGLGFGPDGKPMVPTDFGNGNVDNFGGGGYITVE